MIDKIISGGQTGADRAALDFAIEFGLPHGGWIQRGRKTEDGNLIISHGKLTGASQLTQTLMERKQNGEEFIIKKIKHFLSLFRADLYSPS